ncbi:hypothetical protein V1477_018457, partial [Vespula maculifrons]
MHEVRKPRVWCHTEEYAFSFDDGITTSTSSASPFETIQLKKRNSILDSSKMLTVAKYPSTVNSYTFGYPRQLMNPYLEVLESTPECYESSIPVNAFQLVDTIPGLCISTRFKHL